MSRHPPDPADPQDAIRASDEPSHLRGEPALKRFFRRFLRKQLDADAASEPAFLRAYAAEPSRQPQSLLWRLAKQIALSTLNRKARQIDDYIDQADHSECPRAESRPEDEIGDEQLLGLHCEAVAQMRPQCRQVYLLRKVHGLSHKEIAEHLGLTVTTVEKHLLTAMEHSERYVREQLQLRKAAAAQPPAAGPERREG